MTRNTLHSFEASYALPRPIELEAGWQFMEVRKLTDKLFVCSVLPAGWRIVYAEGAERATGRFACFATLMCTVCRLTEWNNEAEAAAGRRGGAAI